MHNYTQLWPSETMFRKVLLEDVICPFQIPKFYSVSKPSSSISCTLLLCSFHIKLPFCCSDWSWQWYHYPFIKNIIRNHPVKLITMLSYKLYICSVSEYKTLLNCCISNVFFLNLRINNFFSFEIIVFDKIIFNVCFFVFRSMCYNSFN